MKSSRGGFLRLVLGGYHTPRDLVRFAFRRYRARVALISPAGTLSYGQLESRVFRLAQALELLGLGRGDPLFTLLPDDREAVETRLAAAEIGAVLVPLHPAHPPETLRWAAMLARPEVLIYDPRIGPDAAEALQAASPRLRLLPVGEGGEYERMIQCQPGGPGAGPVHAGDPALLLVTPGPGDEPRGLAFTQEALVAALKLAVFNLDGLPETPEIFLDGIPLRGAGGWAVLPVLFAGGTLLLPGRYEAAHLAALAGECRATRALLTPSLLIDLLDLPEGPLAALTASLRSLIVGTAPLPVPKLEEALRRFGPIVQAAYWTPEVPAPVSLLRAGETRVRGLAVPRELRRVAGTVVPGVRVRIAAHDEGPGEILVDSPAAFRGYWGRPDLTGWACRDGWFHTGDLGFLDEVGRLHVLGRRADRLERAGRTLHPLIVEEQAHEHPAVKEACAVDLDGCFTLAVSLRAGRRTDPRCPEEAAEALCSFLAERLESWQVPERVVVLDELPRDGLLRVSRRRVRQALAPADAPRSADPASAAR